MCLTKVVNRHFSWSADGLRRAVLISNIIYLSSPPCGTYTNTVTESDRKFHTLFHHAPAINLIPTATSLGPSLSIPSLKSMVTQCCGVVCRIHLNIFILDSMNLHKLCSVLTAKSRATGLTHMHVLVHTHTSTTPLSKLQARALFGTTGIWQWFMEKGSHTTPWYTQKQKARLPAQTWAQRKVTASQTKPYWQQCMLCSGVNIASMKPDKWIQPIPLHELIGCFQ